MTTPDSFVTIDGIENLESIVNISGGVFTTSGLFAPVNTHFDDTYKFFCFIGATGAGAIDCVAAGYFETAIITVEYTKAVT